MAKKSNWNKAGRMFDEAKRLAAAIREPTHPDMIVPQLTREERRARLEQKAQVAAEERGRWPAEKRAENGRKPKR